MDEEGEIVFGCDGQIVFDLLQSTRDTKLQKQEIKQWISRELNAVTENEEWRFERSPVDIVFEMTTIVYCEYHTQDVLDSPLDFMFFENGKRTTNCKVRPHVLFVALHEDGRYMVMGSMISRTFYAKNENPYISYLDIRNRETCALFQNISVFNEIDYFVPVFVPETPLHVQVVEEMLLKKYYQLTNQYMEFERNNTYAPVIFQYMCFITSPSDSFAEEFIQHEIDQFKQKILSLKHNPFLQYEFIKKWLKVDWRIECVPEFEFSSYPEIDKEHPNLQFFDCTKSHSSLEFAYPSHYIKVPGMYAPWAMPGNTCPLTHTTQGYCVPPIIHQGEAMIPLHFLVHSALDRLRVYMRELILHYRKTFSTYNAFTLWNVDTTGMQMKRIVERLVRSDFLGLETKSMFDKKQKKQRKPPQHKDDGYNEYSKKNMEEYYTLSFDKKEGFKMFSSKDKLILLRTIIGKIWADRISPGDYYSISYKKTIEDWKPLHEHPLLQDKDPDSKFGLIPKSRVIQTTKTRKARETDDREVVIYQDRSEFLTWAAIYWPPCIYNLVDSCMGKKHLKHMERMIVMRFLLSKYNGYKEKEVENFWLMFWISTNEYTTEHDFWKGEYGRYLIHARDHPLDNFPYCNHIIKEDLCPHPCSKKLTDIEDIVEQKTAICTQALATTRRNLFKRISASHKFKVVAPSYYSNNLMY